MKPGMALMTSARLPFLVSIRRRRGRAYGAENSRGDQARRALDENKRFLLIPGVVAGVIASAPASRKSLIDRFGDPKPPAEFSPLMMTRSSDQSLTMPEMFGYCGGGRSCRRRHDKQDTQISAPESNTFFPLAHNPAPRRAAGPEPLLFPASARRCRCAARLGLAQMLQRVVVMPAP